MKKPFLLISAFLTLAVVAFVYAIIPSNDSRQVNSRRIKAGQTTTGSAVTFEWKLANPYILSGASGDVFLDLRVTGKTLSSGKRRPMNLVMVIDRSGSMGSENKLEQVKSSASAIVNNMSAEDRLAIVIYDDAVQTILPSSLVNDKERIHQIIYGLTPGGGTNLCAGMLQGFDEARAHYREGSVNRILLLSDGLANVGISDPLQIASEARRIRRGGISISTLGVGLEYNENLMANLADASGGNYYYVSKDSNMAEVFRREWNAMQTVVATNAVATLNLARDVDVVDVAGFDWKKQDQKLEIQVPDIYSSETKRILVQLRVQPGQQKNVVLGEGVFQYTDMTSAKAQMAQIEFSPNVKIVSDSNLVKNSFDRDVQVKVASVEASKKMDEAYRKFEEGDADGSYAIAQEANEQLNALGYVENREQASRYRQALDFFKRGKAAPMPLEDSKDFLKKQKEQERITKQNTPQ